MAGANNTAQTPDRDPWAPIVLSLDGGGVRGLSTLYILREIMREIKRLDDNASAEDRLEQNPDGQLPLPCHYFDLIIGTSTGGLIAIMLGRLRMGVLDCIQQYWVLSNTIFRPHRLRFVQLYSRRKVQDAAIEVVKQFCDRHPGRPGECTGNEFLRQYDYDEEDITSPNRPFANKTCRVAVLTVREEGITTFVKERSDVPVLFRSYNHRLRDPNDVYELNPKTLEKSRLRIHEACSATSAAPTYFRPVWLWGRKFIDGGVQANNPSIVAWNEAICMANPPYDRGSSGPQNNPRALISIGTGMSTKYHRFGVRPFLRFMARKIVDTEDDHRNATFLTRNSCYWRFNVPDESSSPDRHGLAEIRLSDCKKKHLRPWSARATDRLLGRSATSPNINLGSGGNATANAPSLQNTPAKDINPSDRLKEVIKEDSGLQESVRETRKGGFKPSKYTYDTFNDIREWTVRYCYSVQDDEKRIGNLITECATELRDRSLERRNLERDRGPEVRSWTSFRNPQIPPVVAPNNEAPITVPPQAGGR
ncbi:acyl transferase/acyl hydrolase/lysophospholipase [Nemania abortiva]|nr:acyl transferase/acyl hydrolase/lysophospholipase [Nemania abortiva]